MTTSSSYIRKGGLKREKVYIVSKEKKNYLISIYKAVYEKFMNNDEKYIVYIPVKYRNVKNKNNSIAFSLDNGEIVGDKYFFDEEQTEYTYGYSNLDDLYNKIIKQYESNYKITEK